MITMKAVEVENPGPGYRLTLTVAKPRPGAGEILIKVCAAGLNRADLLQATGNYPPPPGAPQTLGMEVSGEVVEVGAGVANLKAGDQVCALMAGGGYAEFALASEPACCPSQWREPLPAAALARSLFHCLDQSDGHGAPEPGESVLIHGGSSGIGTAAIQLCHGVGHTGVRHGGRAEKCAACEKLGAARGSITAPRISSRPSSRRRTERGVDVIFDMVGGDYIERNFRAAALWGSIVNIAFQRAIRPK